jgi:hypothetical protein
MANVAEWNMFNRNVQSGLLEGRYMSAAYTLIAAGPPRLAALSPGAAEIGAEVETGNIAFPIGLLQNYGFSQGGSLMRLWEIGSQRSYYMRGRVAGQVGLSRIMYHGPSLLRVLYAYLDSDLGKVKFESLYANTARTHLNTSNAGQGKGGRYEVSPGYQNMWVNLASDVFTQPIGLLFVFRDSNGDTVGSFYLENCMVSNHGLQGDANNTMQSESTSLMYERVVPINIQTVALIADSSDIEGIVGANAVGSAV